MNPLLELKYQIRLRRMSPQRYASIIRLVRQIRARSMMEVGVFNGVHARHMIETAAISSRPADLKYYGFDLFEDLTEEMLVQELSKRPPSLTEVECMLKKTGASIELIKGNTHETIPAFAARDLKMDFVFIDGGHSDETIRSDWAGVQPMLHQDSVVLFDDYYPTPHDSIKGMGCQDLLGELKETGWKVQLLPQIDEFPKDWGVLRVQMACVSR